MQLYERILYIFPSSILCRYGVLEVMDGQFNIVHAAEQKKVRCLSALYLSIIKLNGESCSLAALASLAQPGDHMALFNHVIAQCTV